MRKLNAIYSSERDDWETPDDLFRELDEEFHFALDAAASAENTRCDRFFTKEDNALTQSWECGGTVWCNPPYGNQLKLWVKKAFEESQRGATIVMLIPSRTDTKWFHNFIYNKSEIRFIRGRLRFKGTTNNAPFPSMIVIFRRAYERKADS